jgi:hypothetical protein
MSRTYRSSLPDAWVIPRPHTDASQRLHTYGKIQPMQSNRFHAAGINSRKELIGAGLALVVVALVLFGWAVAF